MAAISKDIDEAIETIEAAKATKEIKVKTMVNRYKAKNKEMAIKYIGAIKNNKAENYKSDIVEVTMDQLANEIIQGKAIIPAVIDGHIEDSNFKEQQLFLLDIDYIGTSLEDLKAKFAEYPYSLIYTSFSHTRDVLKYRGAFIADRVITEAAEARKITLSLMEIAGCADEKCVDVSRIFFAGKSIVEINNTTFSVDKLLANSKISDEEVATKGKKVKVSITGSEAAGEENLIITPEEVKANLAAITLYKGMELDFKGSFD